MLINLNWKVIISGKAFSDEDLWIVSLLANLRWLGVITIASQRARPTIIRPSQSSGFPGRNAYARVS